MLKNTKKTFKDDPFVIQESKIKDRQLIRPGLEWVASPRIGDQEKLRSQETGFINEENAEFLGIALSRRKLNILTIVLLGGLLILLLRVGWLQIIKGSYYRGLAEGNRVRITMLSAKRGFIYDRKKVPLVQNAPNFILTIFPADLPKSDPEKNLVINRIAKIVQTEPQEIKKDLEDISPFSYQPLVILENVSYQEALTIAIESQNLPGVNLEVTSRRDYLTKTMSLSHILGYVGRIAPEELEKYKSQDYTMTDPIGKVGLEAFYEEPLRGHKGREEIEVDSLGKKKKVLAHEAPLGGSHLVLTIDLDLQRKLEEVLIKILKENNKTKAAALALDPTTGEILAMVSLPTFDNNLFALGISREDYQGLLENEDKPLFNRAISGEYPSGSTLKPIIAAAALEEGIVGPATTINSVGGIRIAQWFFPDWKAGGHGPTNITKALAWSVNTFFYYIGGGYQDFEGLGIDRIIKYSKLFGLGQRLGIDLIGEARGFLPSPAWKESVKNEPWYLGDTYHLSIGQGDILVTPLQVAAFTAALANRGTLFEPHLVKEIIDSKETRKITPQIIRDNFISQENIEVIRRGLKEAVLGGSAYVLGDIGVSAAAKTGTAQWSTNSVPHSWLTAFSPYESPEIVVTVLIEEGGGGVNLALGAAKEVLKWWFEKDLVI